MHKLLIVDDSELNREMLRDILEPEYSIETAEDGEQALQALRGKDINTAALLLDLHMPRVDGFTVIQELKKDGLLSQIPVLVISGDNTSEIECRCLELGVSDFIHKPFDASIVRNRIKNTLELFSYKNHLEQRVERQAETLKKQSQIIKKQAEKLSQAKHFDELMIEYRSAIMSLETRLNVLNAVFSEKYKRNPFESIKSRLKSPESIYQKLERRGYDATVENIREYLSDVAGLRVICSFPDDIYRLAKLLAGQDGITVLREKDYIKSPKPNGYRSLHLILQVPIYLPDGKTYVKAEVQFRTIAMDFWASLEHKLKYKKNVDSAEEIGSMLRYCADSIEELDYQMQEIRNKIDKHNASGSFEKK